MPVVSGLVLLCCGVGNAGAIHLNKIACHTFFIWQQVRAVSLHFVSCSLTKGAHSRSGIFGACGMIHERAG